MEQYLLNYIKNATDSRLVAKYIDYFKIELDWISYANGNELSKPYHRDYSQPLKSQIRFSVQQLIAIKELFHGVNTKGKNVLTFLPFSDKQLLESLGLVPYSTLINPISKNNIIGDEVIRKVRKLSNDIIFNKNFNEIIDEHLFMRLEEFRHDLEKLYAEKYNFRGLFLFTDQYFQSKFHIEIFKNISKPSCIFLHGLPGIYSNCVDTRSDYLMVWGEKIKENYIKFGLDPNKVIVVGNSKYSIIPKHKYLRNSLDDVLVLTTSATNWHQHEWGNPVVYDKSKLVLYLYELENILKSLGVNKARVRPHPSVDKMWLNSYLDLSFYTMDYLPLDQSLNRATLAIGQISTVCLEAMMSGVNYLVYEPKDENDKTYNGGDFFPPFDGSEKELEIAYNKQDLIYMIKNKHQNSLAFLDGYIKPLDLSPLNKIIK